MEMCYDGALVMPSSYAVMSEEEMTYVEGGWYNKYYWWGRYEYYSHKERKLMVDALAGVGLAATVASMGVAAATLGALATIIWNHDEGYGIKMRYTYGVGYTGVYSLKKGEYTKGKKK